jgi:hypothetical protein
VGPNIQHTAVPRLPDALMRTDVVRIITTAREIDAEERTSNPGISNCSSTV